MPKVKVYTQNRRFPHDDVAVFLSGTTVPANSTFEELELVEDQKFADGTVGLCLPGRGCVTFIGPTDRGYDRVYDEYEVGRFFSQYL